MNTAKKLATPTSACSISEFEQVTVGHTWHFVSDRLNLMLGEWNALSPREYWLWSQLMVRAREFRKFEIEITHRMLCRSASVSEATVRWVLDRLSTSGFIEILDKKVNRYGKTYVIRPSLPRHLLSLLKAELDRCRNKEKIDSKKYTPHKASPDFSVIPPTKIPESKSNTTALSCNTESETQHLSWEGEILPTEEAYLPEAEKPIVTAPYQPKKNQDWSPSFADLKDTISPSALAPQTEAEKRLQIDLAEWAIKTQIAFFKQSHQQSDPSKGYGLFLAQERRRLDKAFPAYLAKILPQGTEAWVPTLLSRMQTYQSPHSTEWFPLTKEMLKAKQVTYEASLNKQGNKKQQPTLSPRVAVSIPTAVLNRIITTVQSLDLGKEKILEIAYHVMNFSPKKIISDEEGKQKYNLRVAMDWIKTGRWGCPLSLEAKRTRYLEGVK